MKTIVLKKDFFGIISFVNHSKNPIFLKDYLDFFFIENDSLNTVFIVYTWHKISDTR